MNNIYIEEYNLENRKEIEEFLFRFGLGFEEDVEHTLVARSEGVILGTCSSSKNIIKSLAVRCTCSNDGIGSKLVTEIMNRLFDKGIYDVFVFTKKNNKNIFRELGFREVISTDNVILMEKGRTNIEEYVNKMLADSGLGNGEKASIVMNCNPITSGHMHLIEKVSYENDEVVVFIVEEEKSLFPFEKRIALVRKCTEKFNNVHVIPGGRYIISAYTFPSYFLRDNEKSLEYMEMDLNIFGKYIKSVFNITKRYIGTEPYCKMTKNYNEGMKRILLDYNIEVVEVDRIEKEGEAVSASKVRRMIKNDNIEGLKNIIPKEVYDYLKSDDATNIIEKIKRSDSLH